VAAAAILHHSKATGGDLIGDAMIEQDHAVRDIFLEAVTRERILTPFASNNRGYTGFGLANFSFFALERRTGRMNQSPRSMYTRYEPTISGFARKVAEKAARNASADTGLP
jgi:hypothetical protein